MPLHAVSGLLLQSDQRIGALPEVTEHDETERIRFELGEGALLEVATWLVEWKIGEHERPYLSVARTAEGYLFRYHDMADFVVEPGSSPRIRCRKDRNCSMDVVEHLLCTQVLAQLAHLQGDLSFHASAVAWPDGTVTAFLGESGSGKSTLAASFVPPLELVCDDALVVRRRGSVVLAFPSYPWTRLYDDAALAVAKRCSAVTTDLPLDEAKGAVLRKQRIPARTRPEALRLRALYIIGRTEEVPRVLEISRRDAVIELARRSYRVDGHDAARLRHEFDQLVELVAQVRVAELRYPRRYDALPAVRALIEADGAAQAG